MTLLVIDTQKGITDSRLYGFETLRANIKALIARAREEGVEVIYVRHDDGPGTGFSVGDDEFQIFEEFAPLEGERVYDKRVNSLGGTVRLSGGEGGQAADGGGPPDRFLHRRHH